MYVTKPTDTISPLTLIHFSTFQVLSGQVMSIDRYHMSILGIAKWNTRLIWDKHKHASISVEGRVRTRLPFVT